LPFTADAKQIADDQHLEEDHRINRRPPVVRAVEAGHPFADERKVHRPLHLPQQMIPRNQLIYRDKLKFRGLPALLLQHPNLS